MYDLRCFGGASLRTSDGTDVRFRSRKHLALLLYLGAHTGRPLDRRFLSSLLWDTEESLARHSLSQALYDLRSNVASLRLDTVSGSLRFRDDAIRYEAARLEEAIRSGDLATAVQLYRGDFAPNLDGIGTGEFERWLESERDRFRRLAQISFRRFVEECDLRGQWGEMCLTALRLVKLNPLDEEAHRALMRALWLHGDQQSALKHFSDHREFLVRELPAGPSRETLDLVERIRSSRPPAEPETGPVTSELPLIGREEEFEQLRKAVRRIRREGKVAVVRGEAGIGKTRLLTEVGRLAPVEGITLLTSRCYPAESDVAYGPVVDAVQPLARHLYAADAIERSYYQLGHLFPDVFSVGSRGETAEAVDPGVRRRRMFEEVADLLRGVCASSPVMWIVEDVQWIDRSSASLLHYISRRLAEKPFLLILSVRSEADLGEVAGRLLRGNETDPPPLVVELGPLSVDAVTELISTASRGAGPVEPTLRIIRKYAGGNPFYALEILRATTGVDGKESGDLVPFACISDRLRTVLASRLRGLSSEALRILEAVAALDRHAAPEHVASVAGLSLQHAADVVSDLHGRGILRESETRYEFAHDITREFVYGNLGLLRRAALHLTTAEVLAKDSTVSPATLARHFEQGRDQARAYEYAMRAAEASASTGAHAEAAAMASLALRAAASDESRCDCVRILAAAEFQIGNYDTATQHFELLLSLEERPREKVDPGLKLATCYIERALWSEAMAMLDRVDSVLSLADGWAEQSSLQVAALLLRLKLAVLTSNQELADECIAALENLSTSRSALDLSGQADRILALLVYGSIFGDLERAGNLLPSLSKLRPELPIDTRVRSLLLEALVLLRLNRLDAANQRLMEGLQVTLKLNDVVSRAHFLSNIGCVALERGEWMDAQEYSEEALTLYGDIGAAPYAAHPTLLNLASCHFFKGEPKIAQRYWREVLTAGHEVAPKGIIAQAHAGLGLAALQLNDETLVGECWNIFSTAYDPLQPGTEERFWGLWFWGYMVGNREEALPVLKSAASAEMSKDLTAAAKLFIILRALCGGSHPPLSLPWFDRFVRRWLRLVGPARAHDYITRS